MPPLLAFDVNETLLDLRALDAPFEELLGDASLRPLWFSQMLQLSFVSGLTGSYLDFTSAQRQHCIWSPSAPAARSRTATSTTWWPE